MVDLPIQLRLVAAGQLAMYGDRELARQAANEIERLYAALTEAEIKAAEWKKCWRECDDNRDGLLDKLAEAQRDSDLWRVRAEQSQAIVAAQAAALKEIADKGTWTGTDGVVYTSAECRIAREALNAFEQEAAMTALSEAEQTAERCRFLAAFGTEFQREWQIVRLEATEAMIANAIAAHRLEVDHLAIEGWQEIWRAMLAASPHFKAGDDGQEKP